MKSSKKIDEGMEKVSKTVLMWPSYNKNKNVEFFCASHWRKTLCIIQMLVMKCAQMYKNMHFFIHSKLDYYNAALIYTFICKGKYMHSHNCQQHHL